MTHSEDSRPCPFMTTLCNLQTLIPLDLHPVLLVYYILADDDYHALMLHFGASNIITM